MFQQERLLEPLAFSPGHYRPLNLTLESVLRKVQPLLLVPSPGPGGGSVLVSLWASPLLHEPIHSLPGTMLHTAAWRTQMDGEFSVRFWL